MDFDGEAESIGATGERSYASSLAQKHRERRKRLGFSNSPIPAVPIELPEAEVEPSAPTYGERMEILCREIGALRAGGGYYGREIAKAVAKAHGISFIDLISARRTRHLAIARQHAMWLMKKYTTLSLPGIAAILGDRDHTTILHGIRRHQARIDAGEEAQ